MVQLQGFIDQRHPNYVCKLHKSLYGLKQAPHAWYQKLSTYLLSVGFTNSNVDPSLFLYKCGNENCFLLVYVDDVVITGNSHVLIKHIIQQLNNAFSLRDLGPLYYFLGVKLQQITDGLFLSQHSYIQDILRIAGMLNCKPSLTLIVSGTTLSKTLGTALPHDESVKY